MNNLQLRASNPEISTWVSASAGTGKTKILTDRVIRLLLQGVQASKILCLTFTNAAAGEMQERITKQLAKWSNMEEGELRVNLEHLVGHIVSNEQLIIAKNLYEKFLSSEDKINIHTIHSFCQKLLKKFPFEADVSSGFQVIDESKVFEIIQKIKRQVQRAPELGPISNYLAENFHEITIDQIFNEIISNKLKFQDTDDENIWQNSKEIIANLSANKEQKYRSILTLPLISNLIDFKTDVTMLKSFFLTQTGEKKKRIVAQKIAKSGSSLYRELEQIQHQIYLLDQEEKSDHLLKYSLLLSKLGINIISRYEKYKKARGFLDYDDLITKANALLKESSARDWVLYKLDGGIEHLLVDEAQDTSPLQWQIIEALIEEFYSGEETKDARTVFVVGDEKQSIFSFQGADISSFSRVNESIETKLLAARKNFETINLEVSYRSVKEILDITNLVFQSIKSNQPDLFPINIPLITTFRSDHSGSVELWPIYEDDKKLEEFWPINNHETIELLGKEVLAIKIAKYIKDQIDKQIILPSTCMAAKPGDFMILFRTRDEFTLEVVKQIKNLGLEVAGIDRIVLSNNLAVLDLISAAKFVLNPDDDLNLACLLKSPLVGLTDDELQELCLSRINQSLWHYLRNSLHKVYNQLFLFINTAQILNAKNFFHYIVDVLGFREKLVAVIGPDCEDAIEELLNYSYNYAITTNCSLQSFVFWFENYQIDIKRGIGNSNKIKIMTVHGAKGLQAPYVIMCDTTSTPISSNRFIWKDSGEALSAKNSNYAPEFFNDLKEEQKKKNKQEYLRLLYVAMTRAEDHLIVCGYKGQIKLPEDCWYKLISEAMKDLPISMENNTANGKKIIYKRKGHHTAGYALENTAHVVDSQRTVYINSPLKQYDSTKLTQEIDTFNKSPLSPNDSLKYGLVFHKILEDGIKFKDIQNLKTHPLVTTLSEKLQNKIKLSIDKLSDNKQFINLLRYTIKTEVTIGDEFENNVHIGRIDLLIIEKDTITIIDYKSDVIPPNTQELVLQSYIDQLNFYRGVIQKLYKNHKVFCKILWLDNGHFMDILLK